MDSPGDEYRNISEEEIDIFADLVGKLLRYDIKERIVTGEVLQHEWFRMGLKKVGAELSVVQDALPLGK